MISVIIPTYNRASTLKRSVESVLRQTVTDLEVIVVDDCSTDDTAEVVGAIEDPRVRYERMPQNGGACRARNRGIELATGDLIALQDSDDSWRPYKLESQLATLEQFNGDVCFCNLERHWDHDEVIPALPEGPVPRRTLIARTVISTQTIIAKRAVFERYRFDPTMPRLQDYEWAIRASETARFVFDSSVLVDAYVQDDSITSRGMDSLLSATETIAEKHKGLEETEPLAMADLYYRIGRMQSTMGVNDPSYFARSWALDQRPMTAGALALAKVGVLNRLPVVGGAPAHKESSPSNSTKAPEGVAHVVLTRFNIPVRYEGRSNPSVTAIDPRSDGAYLQERFDVFERYTVASFESQTTTDFEWWVLFSDQTPGQYRAKLEELQRRVPQLRPLFLSDEEALSLDEYLQAQLAEVSCDLLVTTRIDNDDAVPKDFLQRIQQAAVNTNGPAVLSFPDGAQYTTATGALARQHFFGNHFITFVEPKADTNRVILSYRHDESPADMERVPLESAQGRPMWLEVIHGSNYANQTGFGITNAEVSPHALDDYAVDIRWDGQAALANGARALTRTLTHAPETIGWLLRRSRN